MSAINVVLHALEAFGNGGRVGPELVDDGAQLGAGGVEHGPDQCGDHLAVPVVRSGQQVAHRVDTADSRCQVDVWEGAREYTVLGSGVVGEKVSWRR